MRAAYHEALEGTRLDVVRLGALVADALLVAAEALDSRNAAGGARVVAGDDVVDDLRRRIEAHCIELIWRQQPVAGELREIAAMLNIATDLERIGDYAVELAKNAIKLADQPLRPQRVEIDRIVGVTHAMLLDAMRAYSERDDALASSVIEHDAEVDRLYKRSITRAPRGDASGPGDHPVGDALSLHPDVTRAGGGSCRQHRLAHQGHDRSRSRVTPLPRSEFAVADRLVYLNHAATGVLPRCTRGALEAFLRAQAEGGVLGTFPYELRMPEFRTAIARFIGASGDEIAFLRSTSEAANVLALGFDWREGDEVVLCDNEFPANAIPWLALRRRGVVVRTIETARERMTPDVLERTITARTRVVTVSWVSFEDGYRHDLVALAEIAHRHGAYLCVDGIQGLGALPVDVGAAGVDAFYGSGAKWMLALQGVAFLHVGAALRDRLALGMPGWRSMSDMWDFLNYEQPYGADASRFEGGTPNFLGALSLASSVEFFEQHDREAIAAHILALTDHLVDGLQRMGARIAAPRGKGVSSGIVTFTLPGRDSVEIGRALQREGIVTTYRASGIRVAPHGYNTLAEIESLLDTCGAVSSRLPS